MGTTGLDSFANPQDIGAMYPGFGASEIAMVAILFAFWLIWHIWQIRDENREYREALEHYREVGMERAMRHATGGVAAEDEVHIDR